MGSFSLVIGCNKSSSIHMKPFWRSHQALPWNPISNLSTCTSNSCKDETINSSWRNKTRVAHHQFNYEAKRNLFVVYANTGSEASLPSAPSPSSSPKSWILGIIVSLILPFFTNKLGPLGVIKNRIDNAVQTVEDIAEAVEKVAGEVEKIAEDIADDLPQGNLKNLVKFVEDVAEKTAKTADYLDNIIDEVQEAEDKVEDLVESVAKKAMKSPKQVKDKMTTK